MNGDSDGSEYVDEDETGSDKRNTRASPAKSKAASKHAIKQRPEQSREQSAASEEDSDADPVKGNATKMFTNTVLRSYRDLLNANIAEVFEPNKDDTSDPLPPSQIGASLWTNLEKQRFFTALRSCGSGNLLALATAIGTKSEPEIKAYILLLQEGVRELDAKSTQKWSLADVPAAVEIGDECLEAEEAIASAIEGRARATEEDREKQKWGEERWLLDEEAAAAIDDLHGDSHEERAKDDDGENVTAPAVAAHSVGADDRQSESVQLSSDQLLRPSAFLQLSRTIFMNPKDSKASWRTLIKHAESGPGLSMRRTAFEDYYNLVLSLTRRLMQVSMFQALSRMRASHDPRIVPAVHGHDVIGARELLGMKSRNAKYWAEAVQRCGVDVYGDSRKYRTETGRQGTKNGFRLSKRDLENALGVPVPAQAADSKDISETDEDKSDGSELDSDAYTLASSSDDSADDLSDMDETAETKERRVGSKGRALTDRKRALSPASFNRAETRYLESLDRMKSTAGENELRSLLELEPLPQKREHKPDFPFKQADVESRPQDWREVVQYDAPWEQSYDLPQQSDFDAMEIDGNRRRKRRRLMAGMDNNVTSKRDNERVQDGEISSEDELEDDAAASNQSEDEEGEQEGATSDEEEDEGEDESDAASEQD